MDNLENKVHDTEEKEKATVEETRETIEEVKEKVEEVVKKVAEQETVEETGKPKVEDKQPNVVESSEYTLEVTKDYYGQVDPFYLSKKDPKYQYRFLRADDKNLSIKTGNMLFQKGGWQLCNREHLKKIGIEGRFISPDGLYRKGDTVLAFMPKELYAEKVKVKDKKASDQMNAVKQRATGGDRNNPELKGKGAENMLGLQTKEQLGMK